MVETGVSTDVQASTWLDQDFNVVFLGAIYSPKNDPKKLKALCSLELKRVNLLQRLS